MIAVRRGIHTAVVADSGKDVAEQTIDDLIKTGGVYKESGPGRSWWVFECFSRDRVRERVSKAERVLELAQHQ